MHDIDNLGEKNTAQVLMVPGLDNSGPAHWQSIWEADMRWSSRVDLGLWARPQRNAWMTKLSHAIRTAQAPIILCAHGLGCHAVAWWAFLEGQTYGRPVAGAMLVAPPDCDHPGNDGRLAGFGPAPNVLLPFPALLVASRNDPASRIEQSARMAERWGATFVDMGELGHIGDEAGLGAWHEGRALLDGLMDGQTPGRSRFLRQGAVDPGVHRAMADGLR